MEVYKSCDLVEEIKMRGLEWLGHLMRMDQAFQSPFRHESILICHSAKGVRQAWPSSSVSGTVPGPRV
jgi:hypothetical protein